ncbi:ABC transporter substrate-binding protein [Streptomyces lincolnensis]|uniref:ABC transporter substrate-binding protein n=1 Tax=Streptomyces lincolnensis TaxID=1915 RepID=UPI001E2E3CA0|nr:ABC transporter substrate-binding protein [Streptomyces lincolnensis]MCD7439666.1 ABC transporter substrate-binding protein [Streptomyces lincolnensis]
MPTPPPAPTGFPDDEGADDFVRMFRQALAPAERESLAYTPPLVILDVGDGGDGGAEYDARVRRVVEALERASRNDQDRQTVPHALVRASKDSDLLSVTAARGLFFGLPKNMTPDRLPGFWPLSDSVSYIRDLGQGATAPGSQTLRDHAFKQLRLNRRQRHEGGPQVFLWALGGGDATQIGGWRGFLLGLLWHPITRTLPRWRWERRKTRRLMRPGFLARRRRQGWLREALGMAEGSETVFEVMDEVADRQLPRLALPEGHPRHQESLVAFEKLLTRALLEDLADPPVGRRRPLRRRRTARPLLLVPIPRDGAPGVAAVERFLRAFQEERGHTAGRPGPLVVAVGRPSQRLLTALGGPTAIGLGQAGRLLPQSQPPAGPALVRLRDEPFERDGIVVRRCLPRMFRLGGRAVATTAMTGISLFAILVCVGAWKIINGPDVSYECVGGTQTVAEGAGARIDVRATEWHQSVRDRIDQENKRVIRDYAKRRTVRTVVAFVSDPPVGVDAIRFDGLIPELRGIALWQQELNDQAVNDPSLVPLLVDVRTTGESFGNAEAEAEKLVREVRDEAGQPAYERVVGVLGFAQSRESTQAALKVLDRARIPLIGTTATADEMQNAARTGYWPFTPSNSTEAAIEAAFASRENIVVHEGSETQCTPARHALVIESSADLYSRSLADKFTAEFPGTEPVFDYNQENQYGDGGPPVTMRTSSADTLTKQLCAALREQPDSVVYWSARAKDFSAFVNAMDRSGTCTDHDITVLGGNELTNVAQTGVFAEKDWLRLYYSAHRLPSTDEQASTKTKQFVRRYTAFVEDTTTGTDPWRQDGHSAVSYDAFHVLSQAVIEAYQADPTVSRANVLHSLQDGISFDGATGYVSYGADVNAPPVDKTLVLLRQVANQPEAVVACGAYQQGEDYRYQKQGVPCDAAG